MRESSTTRVRCAGGAGDRSAADSAESRREARNLKPDKLCRIFLADDRGGSRQRRGDASLSRAFVLGGVRQEPRNRTAASPDRAGYHAGEPCPPGRSHPHALPAARARILEARVTGQPLAEDARAPGASTPPRSGRTAPVRTRRSVAGHVAGHRPGRFGRSPWRSASGSPMASCPVSR